MDSDIDAQVVLLGAPQSGKTQLFNRMSARAYDSTYQRTPGLEHAAIEVNSLASDAKKIDLWAITGADSFTPTASIYISSSQFVFCCVDCSNDKTIQAGIDYFKKLLFSSALGSNIKVVLMLTKSDLNDAIDKSAILKRVIQAGIPITSALPGDVFASSSKEAEDIQEVSDYIERCIISSSLDAGAAAGNYRRAGEAGTSCWASVFCCPPADEAAVPLASVQETAATYGA